MTTDTKMFSTPELRVEGHDKVTGAATYAADYSRPGMLHAAFLGSPHPHARIVSIDVTAAKAMPGVHAVLTGEDTRPARFGRRVQDWPVLCWDRVRFIGDRVAVVAADSPEQAEAATRAILVEYEPLPATFDPEEALRPDAAPLHPDAAEYQVLGTPRGSVPHPNAQGHAVHQHGDLEAGFARSARVFEHTFDVARVANGYLEPRATVVWTDGDIIHVVSTNKGPFPLRAQMAASLGLSPERIHVEPMSVGGDFGGKGLCIDEFALSFIARATGRPVRSVLRYSEELQISGTRRGARIYLRTGVDAEGRFTAHDRRIVYDCGAYAAGGPGDNIIPRLSPSAYAMPAARSEMIGAYTNTLPGGSMRAPGEPQITFALESHIDEIARSLGVDPIDFRLANLAKEGEVTVQGAPWHASRLPSVLETIRREIGWDKPLPEGQGRGISIGIRHVGLGKGTLTLSLANGSVEVLTALPEEGTGTYTMLQRIVANELGVAPACVRIRQGSTDETPIDPGHGGSKSTAVHGNAALDAARKLKEALAERGENIDSARPLSVSATFTQEKHTYGTYAEAVRVSVDRETGAVSVKDAVLVADVGTVINPVAVRSQLEGGFVFGLGQAMIEEMVIEDGRVITSNLGDYKLASFGDVPPLRLVLDTTDAGPGPYGAKSVGEMANTGVGAVIANAVRDACGARVTQLPVTSERVLNVLRGATPNS